MEKNGVTDCAEFSSDCEKCGLEVDAKRDVGARHDVVTEGSFKANGK